MEPAYCRVHGCSAAQSIISFRETLWRAEAELIYNRLNERHMNVLRLRRSNLLHPPRQSALEQAQSQKWRFISSLRSRDDELILRRLRAKAKVRSYAGAPIVYGRRQGHRIFCFARVDTARGGAANILECYSPPMYSQISITCDPTSRKSPPPLIRARGWKRSCSCFQLRRLFNIVWRSRERPITPATTSRTILNLSWPSVVCREEWHSPS